MKVIKTSDDRIMFYCEGCEECHGVDSKWTFNGNYEKPTFSPSVLVRGTKSITDEEHEIIMSGGYVKPTPFTCHSFVRDGKIEYLNDCTHDLAGKTVELKDEEKWFEEESE